MIDIARGAEQAAAVGGPSPPHATNGERRCGRRPSARFQKLLHPAPPSPPKIFFLGNSPAAHWERPDGSKVSIL